MTTDTKPFMTCLLPCGLRNAFKIAFACRFPKYLGEDSGVLIEGNLNYEKTFYGSLDTLENLDEWPDIFVSSDVNALYHPHFYGNFLNADYFETLHVPMRDAYTQAGYPHPKGLMAMLPPNLLVFAASRRAFSESQFPVSWQDLLRPELKGKLVLRGEESFFCNALFFPFVKQYGYESIRRLGLNTARGQHPAEMVKAINTGATEGVSAYVMPYSFWLKVRKTDDFQLVWPFEGAIVSPVQMLVKKGAYAPHKDEIDYILSEDFGRRIAPAGFWPLTGESDFDARGCLNWAGWDFFENNDIRDVKDRAQRAFFEGFNQ